MVMKNNKAYTRTRNLFDPRARTPFKISRSRLENFLRCPRCFYLDRRLGIDVPSIPAYTLNSAVDELLKKEFDTYREKAESHPLMKRYGVDAIPFSHPMMDEWREVFKGVQYHHEPTNFIVFGAIDDLWVNKNGEIFVVDYKSTSTLEPITLESQYRQAYKRQMEIYQWLLLKQNLNVSSIGYFVYCNADKGKEIFDARLEFHVEILSYQGNCQWVESVIADAHQCLMADELPSYGEECEYCSYRQATSHHEHQKNKGKTFEFQHEFFKQ